MMTREEAIEIFENKENYVGIQHIPGADVYISRGLAEAINVALTALRPVSREQVDVVINSLKLRLEYNEENGIVSIPKFAVEQMIERLEAIKNG